MAAVWMPCMHAAAPSSAGPGTWTRHEAPCFVQTACSCMLARSFHARAAVCMCKAPFQPQVHFGLQHQHTALLPYGSMLPARSPHTRPANFGRLPVQSTTYPVHAVSVFSTTSLALSSLETSGTACTGAQSAPLALPVNTHPCTHPPPTHMPVTPCRPVLPRGVSQPDLRYATPLRSRHQHPRQPGLHTHHQPSDRQGHAALVDADRGAAAESAGAGRQAHPTTGEAAGVMHISDVISGVFSQLWFIG